jgi:hypothetical protein
VRASSREHYASPTRGAQGNFLKAAVAIPFVLDGKRGHVEIMARGIHHNIEIGIDAIRQQPKITHTKKKTNVKNGTSVVIHWPKVGMYILDGAKSRFLQICHDYATLNPHLTLAVDWRGEPRQWKATDPKWTRWQPCDPTSAHWYTLERFEHLLCGYLAADADAGRQRLIREFLTEFNGLAGTVKQKTILAATGLARTDLTALKNGDGLNSRLVSKLLDEMKGQTRPLH